MIFLQKVYKKEQMNYKNKHAFDIVEMLKFYIKGKRMHNVQQNV